MKRRILKILKWSLLLGYLVVMLGFVKGMQHKAVCNKISIHIEGNEKFVDTSDVNKLLTNNGINCIRIPLNSINFDKIEAIISKHPAVAKAQVYSEYEGALTIAVIQRKPLLRVIPKDPTTANGFYIDSEGTVMPLSDAYTAHVPLLTGEISADFIQSLSGDSVKNKNILATYHYTLNDVFRFAEFISTHELWGPQIEQININQEYDIELIPRVGNHIIVLGDLNNYEFKLNKMEAMYREGFKLADWNQYSVINLKYSNQVVCKK